MMVKISILFLAGAVALGTIRTSAPAIQIPAQASRYRAQLTREAHAAGGLGAPVAMFAAQVHQESRWNPNAKSGVGAQGLAQFMPGTAEWIANLYPADLKPGAPYDAGWALRSLVRYDYWLAKRLPGFKEGDDRWAASLASYNAGLGWIQKAQKAATCDRSLWWDCVSTVKDKRTEANQAQSRDYPERILHKIRPVYSCANW